MLAAAAGDLTGMELVDEIGVMHKRPCHLESLETGSEDFFHKVNAELHQKMLDAKVPHEYTSRPGNHNWTYWGNSIKYHTLFFSDRFRGVKVPTAPDEKAAPAKKTTAKKTAAKK